jgi:importin subunit beta-1
VLGSTARQARQGAAALVARLAVIDISNGEWLELIDLLTSSATADGAVTEHRATALQTLGWICEDIVQFNADALEAHVAPILTAVVHGMRPEEESDELRATAARALFNTLEFAHSSFERENERNHLMGVVFDATSANNENVRIEAYKVRTKKRNLPLISCDLY